MPGTGRARRIGGHSSRDVDVPLLRDSAPQESQDAGNDLVNHEEIAANQVDENPSSESIRKVRGPNRGLTVSKRRKLGERYNIVVSEDRRRIVGVNAAELISEAGIVVRENAPLDKDNWKQIDKTKKEHMWNILKDKFRLTEDLLVKNVVMAQLNRQYCNYRSALHVKYYKPHGSLDRALRHCPPIPNMDMDKWRPLCLYFNSTKFKKRSGINQNNRSKQIILHSGGSKGFARKEYEMRDPVTKEYPKLSELWEQTHYSQEKGDWVNQAAKDVYEEVQTKIMPGTEGTDSVVAITEDDAFEEVLGYKSSYIRGRGRGPKPKSSSFDPRIKEIEESRARELAEARKELEEARKEAEKAKKEAEEAKRESEQARKESAEAKKESGEARKESLQLREQLSSVDARATKHNNDLETRMNQMQNLMMGILGGRGINIQDWLHSERMTDGSLN